MPRCYVEPIIRLNAGIAAVALKYDGDEQIVEVVD